MYEELCPYCGSEAYAEFVHNGVGLEQVTPYECGSCMARQMGPHDHIWHPGWNQKPEDGQRLVFDIEREMGWYVPESWLGDIGVATFEGEDGDGVELLTWELNIPEEWVMQQEISIKVETADDITKLLGILMQPGIVSRLSMDDVTMIAKIGNDVNRGLQKLNSDMQKNLEELKAVANGFSKGGSNALDDGNSVDA